MGESSPLPDNFILQFDDRGLITAIIQDVASLEVLMLGWMNKEALRLTLEGPNVWFFSRSRSKLWRKGEISGNTLEVVEVRGDCDGDALLVKVRTLGTVCHKGTFSCFDNFELKEYPPNMKVKEGPGVISALLRIIEDRKDTLPANSYTTKLLKAGVTRVAQKVVEEAGETAIAACSDISTLPNEVADLIYHTLLLLLATDSDPAEVWRILADRGAFNHKAPE